MMGSAPPPLRGWGHIVDGILGDGRRFTRFLVIVLATVVAAVEPHAIVSIAVEFLERVFNHQP